jgi:hypothetical protein
MCSSRLNRSCVSKGSKRSWRFCRYHWVLGRWVAFVTLLIKLPQNNKLQMNSNAYPVCMVSCTNNIKYWKYCECGHMLFIKYRYITKWQGMSCLHRVIYKYYTLMEILWMWSYAIHYNSSMTKWLPAIRCDRASFNTTNVNIVSTRNHCILYSP